MDHKTKEIVSLWVLLTLVVTSGSVIVSVGSSPTTTFAVYPTIATARVGETFTVDVRVYEAFYIYSWQVYMSWDDTVLELVLARCVYSGFLAGQPEGSVESTRFDHPDWAIFSESTVGSHTGKSAAEGLLVSVTFKMKAESTGTISIDNPTQTLYVECFSPPNLIQFTDFNKVNGNFVVSWPEDINTDGWVNIFDISLVAIDWGTCTVQTRNPSTTSGTWTSGSSAYTSDDTYASCSTKDAEQTYSGYGFVTSTWTSVTKVEVGLERKTDSGGDDKVTIAVSNDGGSSWSGTTVVVVVEELTDTFTWYDFTTAYTWTPSGVGSIAVKLTYGKAGGTATPIYVDWLPVRVTPEPQAVSPYTDLNGDGVVDIVDLSLVAVKFGGEYAG